MNDRPSQFANGDSTSYWTSARNHQLEFQSCESCGHVQFPPRHQCARCWSTNIEPLPSSGRGIIESITIVRRAPLPQFRDRVPYAIASVICEEGPRMITNLVGDDALHARIGDSVIVCFEPDANGNILPQFQRVTD